MTVSSHSRKWDHVRELPVDIRVTAAPGAGAPTATITVDGEVYHQVPDTGFTMLIAWYNGPAHLVRLLDLAHHTVTVTTIRHDGATEHVEPRGLADQDTIDEDIEDYLADAGVPAPPRGYRWYQRLPHSHATLDDFHAEINTRLRELDPHGTATRPHDIAPLLARIVADLEQP